MNSKMIFKLMMSVALSLLCVTIESGDALAASKKGPSKGSSSKKAKGKSKRPASKADVSSSSVTAENPEVNRSGDIQALLNAGLSPTPMLGFGGSVGLINESGSGLEAGLMFASSKVDTITARVIHVSGRYRLGFMKFAYVAGGAGFRMAEGKWFVLNDTESAEYEASSGLNAVTFDLAVGGQMNFGSIVLAADAIGISYPLFKLGVKKGEPAEEDYSRDDANAQQGKFDKVASGLTISIAKVGVGLRF
jgi:hypothetical protein